MVLVSVIIPIYNHAHTLDDCLGTLVWQAYEQDLQVIIVNDGSTDDFEGELKKVYNKYPQVAALNPIIINQENKGAPAARNRGAREATGEYIIFLDADTFSYPGMIERLRLILEDNPHASYAYSRLRYGWKKIRSNKFDPELLKKINYIDVTSLIRKKDIIPFDESLRRFQDWDLWLTMLEQNKTGVFVPEVLYRKIVRGRENISTWIPRFIYKLPWKTDCIKKYERAREIILKKHHLSN